MRREKKKETVVRKPHDFEKCRIDSWRFCEFIVWQDLKFHLPQNQNILHMIKREFKRSNAISKASTVINLNDIFSWFSL